MTEHPQAKAGSFPVPNALVDVLLPSLRDTDLRVLLVVLRQTWGWRDPKTRQPKARDWLTHGRLKRDTGRASEAVSAAVDALARRGLVVAEDAAGRALSTPAERRRAAALYFRPGPQIISPFAPTRRISGKTEIRKAKTTKDSRNKLPCPFRKAGSSGQEAQEEVMTAEQAASIEATRRQIRLRLANISSSAQIGQRSHLRMERVRRVSKRRQ